ncbi:MAG: hypothetical protein ACM3JP_02900, partial [Betaproteobacteria bacterium]
MPILLLGPALLLPFLTTFAAGATLSVSGNLAEGSSIVVSGNQFPSRSWVQLSLDGMGLGASRTSSDGTFDATVTLPPGSAGTHVLYAAAADRKNATATGVSASLSIAIQPATGVAATPTATPVPVATPTPAPTPAATPTPAPTPTPTPAPTATPTPTPTPAAGLVVVGSIANGAALTGTLTWTASVTVGSASSVAFYVDGSLRWTELVAPYQYNGDPSGILDTRTMTNGTHYLSITAAGGGLSSTYVSAVTISNGTSSVSPTPTPTPAPTPAASPTATPTPTPAPTPGLTPSCSTSLQAVVNNAAAGSTVSLGACVYHETVTINKALTLRGPA